MEDVLLAINDILQLAVAIGLLAFVIYLFIPIPKMLVDKDDEQKYCMSRRTTKAYCRMVRSTTTTYSIYAINLSTVVLGIGIIYLVCSIRSDIGLQKYLKNLENKVLDDISDDVKNDNENIK